jgi:hypothetical protein
LPTRREVIAFVRECRGLFDGDAKWAFAVLHSESDELVGSCDVRRVGTDEYEIGYWVRSDRTRRGNATSAASALTDAAFRYLRAERVRIRMDQGNVASARVPPKSTIDSSAKRIARSNFPGTPGEASSGCAAGKCEIRSEDSRFSRERGRQVRGFVRRG